MINLKERDRTYEESYAGVTRAYFATYKSTAVFQPRRIRTVSLAI